MEGIVDAKNDCMSVGAWILRFLLLARCSLDPLGSLHGLASRDEHRSFYEGSPLL